MKALKLSILSTLFIITAHLGFAQTAKQETFKVAGECGMCKKKIETAAKKAGASYASWNTDSKELTVKYNTAAVSALAIQKSVAEVGYDTPNFKATNEAYNSLHECCKYDRAAAPENSNCCKDGKCAKEAECCKTQACCVNGDQACCSKNGSCCASGVKEAACTPATGGVNKTCCKSKAL